ncbi:MAG: hypothetical protein ACE5GX_07645, partial [Thermoanaerobaculia bacterium]
MPTSHDRAAPARSQSDPRRAIVAVAVWSLASIPALADPVVVPTFEGQFGTIPGAGDDIAAANFWVFAAGLTEVPYTLRISDESGGSTVVDTERDTLHQSQVPIEINERAASFSAVDKGTPAVSPWLDPDDNLAGVFAYVEDGTLSGTEGVVVALITTADGISHVTLDNIPTFPLFDEGFNKTAIAADGDGIITVAFTEFSTPAPGAPKVRGQRFDKSLTAIGGFFDITDDVHTAPDVAILDANGDALVVPTIDASSFRITGNIIDTTGPTPVVGAEFPISGVPVTKHERPAAAADLDTGVFTVTWEDVTAVL